MTDLNEIKDTLNLEQSDMKKLPSMLNVLTILTYVGSGLGIIGAIYSYFTICNSTAKLDNLDTSELGSGALGKMMESAMELATKQCDNRLVILLVSMIALGLCVFGAMQMRNLKKQGFILYAIGELLLPIASLIILGSSSIAGMLMLTGLIIPLIFIVLYGTQYKNLVN